MATVLDVEPVFSAPSGDDRTAFCAVRETDELATWRSAWQSLDEAVASPMETFDWIEAAAATFGEDGEPEILLAHRDGEVAAAAPLVRLPGVFGGRWNALNHHRLYEPAEFASRNPAALAALVVELLSRGRPFVLGRVFADASTRAALESAVAPRGRLRVGPQASTPWIPLDASWTEPEAKLSSRRRSDLRRTRKHAEQIGDVQSHCHVPHGIEVDALLDLAFDIERRSWKGESGTALALGRPGDFYRRYAHAAARQGKLRIEFLEIGGETAAMQIGVVHQGRYWVLKVGYDPRFQRASPGILLMVEAIKRSVQAGLVAYELLGTVEPWIQVWTKHERACVSLRFYPRGVRGVIPFGLDVAHRARQRVQAPRGYPGFRVQHFREGRKAESKASRHEPQTLAPISKSPAPSPPSRVPFFRACLLPLARRAARAYIAGPELRDAKLIADQLAQEGFAATLGFWDGEDDSPRSVADQYLAALGILRESRRGDYLSIKLPALQNNPQVLGEVLARARQLGVRIHFDSLGPEMAEAMWSAVEQAVAGGVEVGCSLPGRWRRSLDDAERAIRLGVVPRVVKGQWADPHEPDRDPRRGFLEVVDRLAGRSPRVAVASHDAPLAREAIRRLKAADTTCELELLYGLPQRASRALAAAEQVPVRFYVPFGRAYLPYCLGQIRRRPWLLWWLLRDALAAYTNPTRQRGTKPLLLR